MISCKTEGESILSVPLLDAYFPNNFRHAKIRKNSHIFWGVASVERAEGFLPFWHFVGMCVHGLVNCYRWLHCQSFLHLTIWFQRINVPIKMNYSRFPFHLLLLWKSPFSVLRKSVMLTQYLGTPFLCLRIKLQENALFHLEARILGIIFSQMF